AALATQPLAIQEMAAGELDPDARPPEALDRLAIERLGRFPLGQQRPRASLDATRPVGASRHGCLRKPAKRVDRQLGLPGPGSSLDQLDQPPRSEPDLKRVLSG